MLSDQFTIPNLDDQTVDEDYLQTAQNIYLIALYMHTKVAATRARLAGDVAGALSYDARMQLIYSTLPPNLRW